MEWCLERGVRRWFLGGRGEWDDVFSGGRKELK